MRPRDINKIKTAILGTKYDLSVAFISPAVMLRAMRYKKTPVSKVSNVLAFPLSQKSGEILICKKAAKPYSVPYLFIHGCLHLKGYRHGATMDNIERLNLKRFGFNAHE